MDPLLDNCQSVMSSRGKEFYGFWCETHDRPSSACGEHNLRAIAQRLLTALKTEHADEQDCSCFHPELYISDSCEVRPLIREIEKVLG